jgi:YhcH/YjgK/YiaL family protein
MIIDKLTNLKKYAGLNPGIAEIITGFAAQVNAATQIKKYILDEDRVFALVQEYAPREFDAAKVEIHRRYIDIHVPVCGEELICYCPIDNLELIEDFTPKSDDLLYKLDPQSAIKLVVSPGSFVWFNPEEGHAPCLKSYASPAMSRKIVFKVDAALF